jgi:hypothetical protein
MFSALVEMMKEREKGEGEVARGNSCNALNAPL